jgi:hypothetical protein
MAMSDAAMETVFDHFELHAARDSVIAGIA